MAQEDPGSQAKADQEMIIDSRINLEQIQANQQEDNYVELEDDGQGNSSAYKSVTRRAKSKVKS